MLGNFLIGLREGLEASLIVSLLIAYLVKSGRRSLLPAVWVGVGVAVALSVAVGAALEFGPNELGEEAEELLAGTLSILAVALVTWMIFWMAKASGTIASDLREHVDATADRPWAVAVVAFLAVGREGLETALFVWAASQASAAETGSTTEPLLGALLGLAVAVALGWLLYAGALRINLGRFFTVTGGFLIVVAAGVLAYGVHELQEVGVLPGADDLAFDVSAVIAKDGVLGSVLRGVFNFTPTPTVAQVVAWVGYVAVVGFLFFRTVRGQKRPGAVSRSATVSPTDADSTTADSTDAKV